MNCRLNEIRRVRDSSRQASDASYSDIEDGRKNRELQTPLLMDGPERSEHAAFMHKFFSRVEEIKEGISFVNRSTAEVRKIKEGGGGRGASDGTRLATVVMRANKRAIYCKDELQAMRKDLARIQEEASTPDEENKIKNRKKGSGKSSRKSKIDLKVLRTLRVRQNVVQALMRRFVDTMNSYQRAQQECKEKMEENTLRQVGVVSPESTREELSGLLNSGGGRKAVVGATTQAVLKMGTGKAESAVVANSRVRNSLKMTEGRYDEVLVLEASIMELAKMFEDFVEEGLLTKDSWGIWP